MEAAVDRVLAQRQSFAADQRSRRPLITAAVLHLSAVLLAVGLPHLLPENEKPPIRYVSVQVVPLAALGVKHPPQRERRPPPPKPEPQQAAPPPTPKPEPVPPPPSEPVMTVPRREPPPVQPEPEPVPTAPVPLTPTREGSETGSRLGTATFGAAVTSVDNPDFTYTYYIDRMTALIRSHWNRPATADGVSTTLRFRIGKNGGVTELEVIESSGQPAFDRAALRAVLDAAPLPPLPVGYRHDSLGVTLIVR